MKLFLHHGTTNKFDKFDLSFFDVDSLLGDSKQFGIYFYAYSTRNYCFNATYYAKKKKPGYVWFGEFEYDRSKVLNSSHKMSIGEYTAMCKKADMLEYLIPKYHKFVNNNHIFEYITRVFWNKYKNWNKVAEQLIKLGYDGLCDIATTNFTFGTVVIWNVKKLDKIKRHTLEEYTSLLKH